MSKSALKSPASSNIGARPASSRSSPWMRTHGTPNASDNKKKLKGSSEKTLISKRDTIALDGSVKPSSLQSFSILSENKTHWTSNHRHTGISPPPAGLDAVSIQKWKKYSRTLEIANRNESNHETHHSVFRPIPDSRGRELYFAVAIILGKSFHNSVFRAFHNWKKKSLAGKQYDGPPYSGLTNSHPPTVFSATIFRGNALASKPVERWNSSYFGELGNRIGDKSPNFRQEERLLAGTKRTVQHSGNPDSPQEKQIGIDNSYSPNNCDAKEWSRIQIKSLGMMPEIILPIFQANEPVLWRIYCEYVLCNDPVSLPSPMRSIAASTSKDYKLERNERRMMTYDTLWTVLRDFGICPDICSKPLLQSVVRYVQYVGGSGRDLLRTLENTPTHNNLSSSSLQSSDKYRANDLTPIENSLNWLSIYDTKTGNVNSETDLEQSRLSFAEFCKVLWQLSFRCMDTSQNSNPKSFVQKLFRLMDRSEGRTKMARRHRTASVLPAFNVLSSISKEQGGSTGIVSYALNPINEHVNLGSTSSFKSRKVDKLSWSDDDKIVSAAMQQKLLHKQNPTDKVSNNNAIDNFFSPVIMDDFVSVPQKSGYQTNANAVNSSTKHSLLFSNSLQSPTDIKVKGDFTPLIFG